MGCEGKQQHLDKAEATATLKFLKQRFRSGLKSEWTKADIDRLHVYKCPECRFWHLGKTKKPANPATHWVGCHELLKNATPPVLA